MLSLNIIEFKLTFLSHIDPSIITFILLARKCIFKSIHSFNTLFSVYYGTATFFISVNKKHRKVLAVMEVFSFQRLMPHIVYRLVNLIHDHPSSYCVFASGDGKNLLHYVTGTEEIFLGRSTNSWGGAVTS